MNYPTSKAFTCGEISVQRVVEQEGPFFDAMAYFPDLTPEILSENRVWMEQAASPSLPVTTLRNGMLSVSSALGVSTFLPPNPANCSISITLRNLAIRTGISWGVFRKIPLPWMHIWTIWLAFTPSTNFGVSKWWWIAATAHHR